MNTKIKILRRHDLCGRNSTDYYLQKSSLDEEFFYNKRKLM